MYVTCVFELVASPNCFSAVLWHHLSLVWKAEYKFVYYYYYVIPRDDKN